MKLIGFRVTARRLAALDEPTMVDMFQLKQAALTCAQMAREQGLFVRCDVVMEDFGEEFTAPVEDWTPAPMGSQ